MASFYTSKWICETHNWLYKAKARQRRIIRLPFNHQKGNGDRVLEGLGNTEPKNTSAFGEVVIPSSQLKFKLLVGQKYVCFIFVLLFQQSTFALFILLMA